MIEIQENRFTQSRLTSLLQRASVQLLLAFVVITVVMAWIQFSGKAILDNDGYYHIRWSQMLGESFPKLPPFKALPLTTLSEADYVDHHYLFHVLLIPFTYGDLRIGAKLAAVFYSSLALTALFALLVLYRVPYRWLWLAPLVASSEPFLYRMSMTRAPSLSLVFLGVGAYLILQRKLIWLALLSFAFVWAYSLFPLILMLAGFHFVCVYLAERRFDFGAIVATLAGIVAGLVINPYFPKNFKLFADHLAMKLTATYAVDVGVEWYPYDAWVLMGSSAVAFVILLVAFAGFNFRKHSSDIKPLFFLLTAVALLIMAVKSRRFIEYFPPFAVIFAAFTIHPRIHSAWFEHRREQIIAATVAALVAVVFIATMIVTVARARLDVKNEANPFAYKGAGEWLAANTAPGTLVFNTDWDDFPMLYYYSPQNVYVAGLDPTYLYDRDKELWNLYANITLGRESDAAYYIKERFGAEYIFTDNYHTDFLSLANRSSAFETVYKDKDTTVLRILAADRKE